MGIFMYLSLPVFTNMHGIWHVASTEDILLSKRGAGKERRKGEGGRMGREGEKKGETENLRIPMFF